MSVEARRLSPVQAAEDSRLEAARRFKGCALPGLKTESYRYFPVQGFEQRLADKKVLVFSNHQWAESECHWSNGVLSANFSQWKAGGLEIQSLEEAFWEKDAGDGHRDFFKDWIDSSWTGGWSFRLKAGKKLNEPLRLVIEPSLSHSQCLRRLIYLEEGSELHLMEDWSLEALSEKAWIGSHLQIVLEAGARLVFQQLERGRSAGYRLERHEAWLNQSSQLQFLQLPQSAQRTQVQSHFFLDGESAEVDAKLSAIGSGKNVFEWQTSSFQRKPNTKSQTQFFGLAQDRSKLVFDALIDIPKEVSKVEAHQNSRSLLLNDQASVVNMPKLKIATDDVLVTHGAAVSSFDEEQIFYLRSRGLSEEKARETIVLSFVNPLLEELLVEELREELQQEFKQLLGGKPQ